jgi:predicted nucleotidyltransferase
MVALDVDIERRAMEAARALGRRGIVRAVYVFGSHVTGRADEWSDIDVAAFMEGIENWDFWQRTQVMAQVQMEVGHDIEPHLFPASALENAEPGSFAADIIKHGVRII